MPKTRLTRIFRKTRIPILVLGSSNPKQLFGIGFVTRKPYSSAPNPILRAWWLLGLGDKKKMSLPDIAREVGVEEIGSEWIQKIVDDMVWVMRKAPGVGLAAPQIGIPLRIIVLEDTKGSISYAPKEETKA
ncbi:hypothetical protein ACB092_03G003400 [Castanea dentata]